MYELVLVAVYMENKTSDLQPKCQGPLQLLSPPFVMTSTTKQMRPNGRGGEATVEFHQNTPNIRILEWLGY